MAAGARARLQAGEGCKPVSGAGAPAESATPSRRRGGQKHIRNTAGAKRDPESAKRERIGARRQQANREP